MRIPLVPWGACGMRTWNLAIISSGFALFAQNRSICCVANPRHYSLRDKSRASSPGLRRETPRDGVSVSTRVLRTSTCGSGFGRSISTARMPRSRRGGEPGSRVLPAAGALEATSDFLVAGCPGLLPIAPDRGPVFPLKVTPTPPGRVFSPLAGIFCPVVPDGVGTLR